MKKILWTYIKMHWMGIAFYLSAAGIFFLVFYLYNIRPDAAIYAFTLSLVPGILLMSFEFHAYYKSCKMLMQLRENQMQARVVFPKARDMSEQGYQELLLMLWEEKREAESAVRMAQQEMLDYFSMWAHQTKVPISAMSLLLQTVEKGGEEELPEQDRKLLQSLKMELFKTEQYVEMALSYLRMEDMSSDLVLQWYPVSDIVKQAVRKYSQMFILKKIKLNFVEPEELVLTDEKWLLFVLEQLLSNALKYTKEGTISIYMSREHERRLVIEDTGIGIQAEDLPRIFEKGFTGYNGRKDKKSTGIGLYLCRQILRKLNHGIEITSGTEGGTRVTLTLDREIIRVE